MNYRFILNVVFLILIFNSIDFSSTPGRFNSSDKKKYNVSDLQKQIDILHYHLKLDLNTNKKIVNGITTITAAKINNLNSNLEHNPKLELNLYDNLNVLSVKINGYDSEYSRNKNRIFIKFAETVKDTFEIEIVYNGTPQRGGFDGFVFGEVKGNSLIYNISEPDFASTWFPCDDDPSDKALLDIEITNDSQYVSVSNGLLKSVSINGSKKTYNYHTVYPISTYLIAVYSAPYKMFYDVYKGLNEDDSMKIEYYVMPEHYDNAKIDFADHLDMMKTLSKIFR